MAMLGSASNLLDLEGQVGKESCDLHERLAKPFRHKRRQTVCSKVNLYLHAKLYTVSLCTSGHPLLSHILYCVSKNP